ncbi:MAG: ATP-grasp domain-containing protein [Nitrospiraceae bacterium]
MRILFTGGGGAGSEAIWRLLKHRYVLHFGDADPLAVDPAIPEDRRHQLPWASDPDFLGKMADLCHRLSIDLLVPGVDEELLVLARGRDVLAPTRLLLPHAGYVGTMLDKLSMVRALSEKQVRVPFSRTLADGLDGLRFPCIAKPRHGRGSREVRVLHSSAEAVALGLTEGSAAENTLLQEKIEGTEYTVQMAADAEGRLRAVVPARVSVKRGITLRAETEAEPRVIDTCREIHQAAPASGCYNVQLMLTSEGNVLPFEINPRVSTTLCLTVAAGIDPIAVFLGHVRCDDLQPFAVGVQLRRHWTNYFSNSISL